MRSTTRAYNTITDEDFTPETIQEVLDRLYDEAFAAASGNGRDAPVFLTKTALSGSWYVIRGAEPGPGTTVTATWKAPIENSSDLDRWKEDSDWLSAVLTATGKTREELADLLGLVVQRTGL